MRISHMPAVTRRFSLGLLTMALIASLAPADQAAAAKTAITHRIITRHALTPARSRFSAAEVAALRNAARFAHAGTRTGVISGVVRDVSGSPLADACVRVSGAGSNAVARTRPDGRYLLGGLRPGQYQVSAGVCPNHALTGGQALISASHTSGPTEVTVHGRQVIDVAPIVLWQLAAAKYTRLPASATAKANRGSISGLVTGHGRPLAGVCAYAVSDTPVPARAVTSKTGKYRITGLRPGRYVVAFVADFGPCHNDGNWLIQFYPGVNSLSPGKKVRLVRVRAGKDTRGIDARLKRGGQISGTVRAKSGKPLSGICVNVQSSIDNGDGIEFGLTTNKTGQYAAHGLYPGGYQVEFSAGCGNNGNYASQWWRHTSLQSHARTVRITGTRHVTGIDATLLPGAFVSGVVKAVSAKGKPLAGVCVDVFDADDNDVGATTTPRTGKYRVEGLAAGHYQIQFDPECSTDSSPYEFLQLSLTLKTAETRSGFNAYLPLGGGISGVVTDSRGHPVGGVCVQVNDDNADITTTGRGGRYSLTGVPDGSFQVLFFGGCGNTESVAPQFYPQSPTSVFAKTITFKPNTVTPNVDARMLPGGAIAGTVTDTAGHRLSRICVSTESTQGQLETSVDTGTATAQNGRYLVQDLAPGAYDLGLGCGGYGFQFYPGTPNPLAAGLISVNPGTTTRVASVRLGRAGSITGRVTTKAGRPIPFVCVQVALAGTGPTFYVGFGGTDGNGHYNVDGLAPARYLVQFVNCGPNRQLAPQWYRRAATTGAATPVKVRSGRTSAGINGVLTDGGSITGLVAGPTGKPANAICVIAFSQQAQYAVSSQTGKAGRYRLTRLSTGRWSLIFTPCFPAGPNLATLTRPGSVHVVAPRTVTGVNVKLSAGGSVSGRVSSQAGDRPLGDVCVLLVPAKASGSFGIGLTRGNGRYLARNLAPGTYHAYIADPACDGFPDAVPPFAPQWYNDQPTETTATTVHVSAGAVTTGIDSALGPFGAVTGTVRTRTLTTVSGECVTAVPFRAGPDLVTGAPAQPETAVTDQTGGYTLTGLTPGRYKIEFTSGCGGARYATQWWDNAGSARSAKVITVGFTTIAGIDATVHR